jgi:hypothetical protein
VVRGTEAFLILISEKIIHPVIGPGTFLTVKGLENQRRNLGDVPIKMESKAVFIFGALLVLGWILYSGWVITIVMRSLVLTKFQKVTQVLICIMLPFVGALVVHGIHWFDGRPSAKSPIGFTEQNPHDGGPMD